MVSYEGALVVEGLSADELGHVWVWTGPAFRDFFGGWRMHHSFARKVLETMHVILHSDRLDLCGVLGHDPETFERFGILHRKYQCLFLLLISADEECWRALLHLLLGDHVLLLKLCLVVIQYLLIVLCFLLILAIASAMQIIWSQDVDEVMLRVRFATFHEEVINVVCTQAHLHNILRLHPLCNLDVVLAVAPDSLHELQVIMLCPPEPLLFFVQRIFCKFLYDSLSLILYL